MIDLTLDSSDEDAREDVKEDDGPGAVKASPEEAKKPGPFAVAQLVLACPPTFTPSSISLHGIKVDGDTFECTLALQADGTPGLHYAVRPMAMHGLTV